MMMLWTFNTAGTLFLMTMQDHVHTGGVKMVYWESQIASVDFALDWLCGMKKIPF